MDDKTHKSYADQLKAMFPYLNDETIDKILNTSDVLSVLFDSLSMDEIVELIREAYRHYKDEQ